MSDRGESTIQLLDGLVESTEAGRVQWSPTDLDNTFLMSTPSGTVTISRPGSTLQSVFGSGPSIRTTDAEGNEVLKIDTGPLTRGAAYDDLTVKGGVRVSELREIRERILRLFDLIPSSTERVRETTAAILRDVGQR